MGIIKRLFYKHKNTASFYLGCATAAGQQWIDHRQIRIVGCLDCGRTRMVDRSKGSK